MIYRHHSHVWASVTSSADPKSLSSIDRLPILAYSDSASLGGVQSVTLTLPGRVATGSTHRPLRELINVGDLVRTAGFNWNGKTGKAYALSDLIVTDVQVQEVMQDGGYQLVTQVQGQSLQHVLSQDTVAWWMYYGSVEGFAKAKAKLMADDASGHLDRMFRSYLTKVAFHFASWNRDNVGLNERIALDLRSLPGNAGVQRSLLVAEGSHWGILSEHADLPMHELFMQMRAPNDPARPAQGNERVAATYRPPALSSTTGAQADDGAAPTVVLRPAPFPYADEQGKGRLDEWQALPLHDFTTDRATTGQHSFGRSISSVKNFFMVFPSLDALDERMAFTQGLAVLNRDAISRYSYRPVKFRTRLVLKDGDKDGFLALARLLTWRIAGQMNRADAMANGSITVPFSPQVQPGDRARFRLIGTDGNGQGVFEGYVTARSHSWSPEQGGQTTLSLERVLPASIYQDASWFVQGLAPIDMDWDTA